MLRITSSLGLLFVLSVPQVGQAKPLPQLGELPDIEEVLEKAGWTMTPEMSAAYSDPGDIFDANNGLLKKGSDCFSATAQERAYASMEVNRSLEAGVRMRVMVTGVRVGMGIEKKLLFDTPMHRQIPWLDLVPTDACRESILRAKASGEDISGWYVVTESLSAVVQKQQCGSFDAKAGVFVLSGDVEVQQLCSQTSIDPVAVAYKTRPIERLLSRSANTPTPATSAATPSAAQASWSSNFDRSNLGLDVEARLREQRCSEEAKTRGHEARQMGIQEAVRAAQADANQDWTRRSAELEQCTRLKRNDRTPCIAATQDWIQRAEQMSVEITAGVERVETECGQREVAFGSEQRSITAEKLAEAQSLLKRLSKEDGEGCGAPASNIQVMQALPMSRVDPVVRRSSKIEGCVREWHHRQQLVRWVLQLPIKMTVGQDGSVQCVETLPGGGDLIDDELRACIASVARGFVFQIQSGPITLIYPLILQSQ